MDAMWGIYVWLLWAMTGTDLIAMTGAYGLLCLGGSSSELTYVTLFRHSLHPFQVGTYVFRVSAVTIVP